MPAANGQERKYLQSLFMFCILLVMRRPGDPIPLNEDDYCSPFERLAAAFGIAVEQPYNVISVQPLFRSTHIEKFLDWVGVAELGTTKNGQKKIAFPYQAEWGDHPTAFLQWCVEFKRSNHVVFEIGDAGRLVRFDFKKEYLDAESEDYPWSLDQVIIEDGGINYNLDCEDELYVPYIYSTASIVRKACDSLTQGKTNEANLSFNNLDEVILKLNDLSEKLRQEDMNNWLDLEQRVNEMR